MKEILVKLRTDNRYTQDQIARMLGISRQSYIKYEAGEVEPTVEMIRKLSQFYSVPYDVLIDNKFNLFETKYPNEKPVFCSVADSHPVYTNSSTSFDTKYFSEQLDYLKEVITSLQKKLFFMNFQETSQQENKNVLLVQKQNEKNVKKINKEEFFNKYGNVKIDDTYVDKWRQESLI